MAEEGRIAPSDPQLETPTADGFGSMKPQTLDISGLKMPYALVSPGTAPILNPEYNELGAGIYAIQCFPSVSPISGFSPTTLIPMKYNIPTRPSSGGTSSEQAQEVRQQHGPQRPHARRVQFAFQLDLGLIIKLAAMVFLFSQDGSPQKLLLLIFFALFVYLYQTGALTPFMRWLQQAAAPPRPHAPPQQLNVPPIGHDGQHNPQPLGAGENNDTNDLNQDHPLQNQEQVDANQNHQQPEQPRNNFWQVVKEIQMFVIGFLASLLPGYHPNNN
ncbi:uncharacterized protein LOC121982466 [Zingiber officinale]|uniref:Transmembrane protein n=1 Tax=Zingiber officinale TaxID=94328 RepID=A0A8J5LDP8_ZINOF|nr:uncharacterized protein LOC121982466 [Zingiber officinale]KAG6509197.1 hypothetical protein ZIOFF_034588 [Zingiber officinale]